MTESKWRDKLGELRSQLNGHARQLLLWKEDIDVTHETEI